MVLPRITVNELHRSSLTQKNPEVRQLFARINECFLENGVEPFIALSAQLGPTDHHFSISILGKQNQFSNTGKNMLLKNENALSINELYEIVKTELETAGWNTELDNRSDLVYWFIIKIF